MKCKPYSEITVEIRTQLKTVKITSNIFAVYYETEIPSLTRILLDFVFLLFRVPMNPYQALKS